MNKKMIIIGVTLQFLFIGFTGCIESGENLLIGSWEIYDFQDPFNIRIEYTFFEDLKFLQIHTYHHENQTIVNYTFFGDYEISEDLLKMIYENNLPAKKIKYTFKVHNMTLTISRRDVLPVDYRNLTRVSFEPLRELPYIDKKVKVSPQELVIDIDDLPNGYKICHNGTEEPGRIVDPVESFSRIFTKQNENCSNFEEGLISIIMLFSSSLDASIFYHETKLPVIIRESDKILNNSVNTIGNESFAHYYLSDKLNESQIYYWFRISNLVGLIKVPYNYSLTQNLTKLVEQRVYESIG